MNKSRFDVGINFAFRREVHPDANHARSQNVAPWPAFFDWAPKTGDKGDQCRTISRHHNLKMSDTTPTALLNDDLHVPAERVEKFDEALG